jgi:hypothetical protein
MSDIRFIDALNVGAYTIDNGGGGSGSIGINILENVNNYVITATGYPNIIQGEPNLQFDGLNLTIGGNSSGTTRLEVYHTGSIDNLMLIRNTSTNTGIKVDGQGRFQLLEFSSLPSPVEGGIVFASNEFYVGI